MDHTPTSVFPQVHSGAARSWNAVDQKMHGPKPCVPKIPPETIGAICAVMPGIIEKCPKKSPVCGWSVGLLWNYCTYSRRIFKFYQKGNGFKLTKDRAPERAKSGYQEHFRVINLKITSGNIDKMSGYALMLSA
ncbi:MAG: hypothetical protein ACK2UW_15955 [Anaerolineales bacterium]